MKFRKDFSKKVYGYFEVEAKDKEEAEIRFNDGEADEFDNKSDYDCGDWVEQ